MLIVFSDLDGCLLDPRDYSFEAARPALGTLRAARVPLVLCSSKTRSEMLAIAGRLRLRTPLVVENGGALLVPSGPAPLGGWMEEDDAPAPWTLVRLGTARAALLAALPQVAQAAGVEACGFSSMSPGQVEALTGLRRDDAARALEREFDEPFVVPGVHGRDLELDRRLDEAARVHDLRVSHGGRLHHLHGRSDKGDGVRAVLALYAGRRLHSIGLGDAATDLPLLTAVERPILLPGPSGFDPLLTTALPQAERAPWPGPRGWNAALVGLLAGDTEWRLA